MNNPNEIPPEELERIERYLSGNMDEKELHDFKQSLESDVQLQHNTREIQLLLAVIDESGVEEKLNEFNSELNTNAPLIAPLRKITIFKKFLIAASVLAIVSFSYWLFFYRGNQDEKLYSKYYSPDPGLSTVMGHPADYDFEKAMVEYKDGEYAKAFDTWSLLLKQRPASDTLIYFVAMAAQGQQKDSLAINRLRQIVSNPNSTFYKDANWYLGLLYVKKGEPEKAINYIKQSADPRRTDLINDINNK